MKHAPQSTVFLVDDDEAVRDSLAMLLRAAGLDVQVFASAAGFLDRYRAGRAGCLVLDIRMPEMSGLMLQDEMQRRHMHIPIVFLTGHGDIRMAVEALKKGAFDFIEKPFREERLLSAVGDALKFYKASRRRLGKDIVPSAEAAARLASLSERERDVLERMLAGKQTRAIAQEFGISVKTVEFHRARIRRKLGVASLVELFELFPSAAGDSAE